ncbi:unnamed protein product, partial [Ectocarpus fasciculatus]
MMFVGTGDTTFCPQVAARVAFFRIRRVDESCLNEVFRNVLSCTMFVTNTCDLEIPFPLP